MRRILLVSALVLLPLGASAQARTDVPVKQTPVGSLLVIDDVIIGQGLMASLGDADMAALNIISFEVLKGDLAARLYGERARAGAMILRTKQDVAGAARVDPGLLLNNASAPGKVEPLLVVDGVVVGRGNTLMTSLLDPASIENVEVVRGAAATNLYGDVAASGVIRINMKKK